MKSFYLFFFLLLCCSENCNEISNIQEYTIKYEILGDISNVTQLGYTNQTGLFDDLINVSIPWEKEVEMPQEIFNSGILLFVCFDSGLVTLNIYANGDLKATRMQENINSSCIDIGYNLPD